MTPKEKAEELLQNFNNIEINNGSVNKPNLEITQISLRLRKKIALIAIDETLRAAFFAKDEIYNYYLEVYQEIEKL